MWLQDKAGCEVGSCPNCFSVIEKNGGCPDMTCHVCQYRFCWTCGLASKGWFHIL